MPSTADDADAAVVTSDDTDCTELFELALSALDAEALVTEARTRGVLLVEGMYGRKNESTARTADKIKAHPCAQPIKIYNKHRRAHTRPIK